MFALFFLTPFFFSINIQLRSLHSALAFPPFSSFSYLFELHLLTLVNSRKMSDVDPRDCVEVSAACPVEESIYGYYPSRPANYFFTIIFGICLIIQLFQGIKWKSRAFAIAMCFGCLGECIGKDSCGHTPSHDGH